MSDDIFKRSDTGFESSELHKHGGPSATEEDRTEREDLEDAIEALNDSEETENLEEIEKDIISEGEDIEPIEDEKPIEVKKPIDIKKPIDDFERKPIAKPVNDWKAKPENKPFMTIDKIEDPKPAKKKCGKGWKVATFIFLLLAAAGCSATAYLFFVDGKIDLIGRTVESYKTGSKKDPKPAQPATKKDETDTIFVNEYGLKVKMPKGGKTIYQYSGSDIYVWYVAPLEGETRVPNFANPSKSGAMVAIHFSEEKLDETAAANYTYVGKIGKAHVYTLATTTLPGFEYPAEQPWFETSLKTVSDYFAQAASYEEVK